MRDLRAETLLAAAPEALRAMADQAFSRAAGAPLVHGNAVRLLRDARENYPAWLSAIAGARATIHFESYIIHGDEVGARFVDALLERAAAGVGVRVLYDWMGALTGRSGPLWKRLREGGAEVRCFNPPRFTDPMGWFRRDHRKSLVVDGRLAFVTGLCVGKPWEGWPEKGVAGWRDTGIEIRGPAVADVARAFGQAWASCGPPLPEDASAEDPPAPAGDLALRVVATTSGTSRLFRVDSLVAALARRNLWLTDAYYAGTPSYVHALRAAARDGVDVRLLVPGPGSDIALMQSISRSGYRPLLGAGVRVFEWNGPMLHAKTAVADGRWARVGSTNLNLASWIGNWELDVIVEDEGFGAEMEATYLVDLENATEIVLERRWRLRSTGAQGRAAPRQTGRARPSGGGRAAASAMRIGHAIGSVIAAPRLHGAPERRLMVQGALILAALAAIAFAWPSLVAWPLGALALWVAAALLVRASRASRPNPR